jgi:hypothetical protein
MIRQGPMKNRRNIFWVVLIILAAGIIGCSSGGTSTSSAGGGGSATDPLVGTWKCDGGIALGTNLVFNADHTGDASGSGFHDWSLNENVLTFTLDNGTPEAFQLVWDTSEKKGFTFTNLNPATPDMTHYRRVS